VANYPATMAGALAAADRVFEVLDLASEEGDRPGEVPARFEQRIEYRGVSFSYNGQAPVLEGLDFEVRRGQVVAVVGPSGAGKTTLVDLLPRFYEPKRGAILMDGVPITRFTRTSLRGLMGIVSQETILLNDTVLANISYGRSDFTLEQVQAAARAANAHDFVSQLPEGYRTLLGERGTRLSGGERQRIAVTLAYPIVPALRSIRELCDEVVVNVGKSDDHTRDVVAALGDPRIRILDSAWDLSRRSGALSHETNRAMAACRGEWGVYIQ